MKLVDENKRLASDHLKAADKLIKAGEFDRASEEIAKARIADPRNLYILAYEERIQYAREEAYKKSEEARRKKEEEELAAAEKSVAVDQTVDVQDSRPEEVTAGIEEFGETPAERPEPEPKNKSVKRAVLDDFAVESTDPEAILDQINSNADRIARETVEDERTRAQTEYKEKIENEIRVYESESQKRSNEQIQKAVATFQKRLETEAQVKLETEIKDKTNAAEKVLEEQLLHLEDRRQLRYSECVKELFSVAIEKLLALGLSDEEYTRILTGIAHGLNISPEQTLQMKKKTQEHYYMDAVEVAWSDGTVSLEESERLSALRDRFGITAEEHFQIESLVRRKMLEMKK